MRAGSLFRRDPLAFFRQSGEWRNIMRLRAGFTEFTLVNHPDLIRRILVTDYHRYGEGKWTLRGKRVMGDCLITRDGAAHRQRRAEVGPRFDRAHIERSAPALVRSAERLGDKWREGQAIDARLAMGSLSMVMAGHSLFGADLEAEADELMAACDVLNGAIPRPPLPRPRVAAAWKRVARAAERLAGSPFGSHLREAGVDDVGIRDEILSLLMAAGDTTPRALAWIWLMLARYPAVASRFERELAAEMSGPVPAGAPSQSFIDMVVNEVLRLYPPVHFLDRRPLEDVELDGVLVRAGSYVLISPLITQRDPRFFDQPDTFRPERWHDLQQTARTACLSFPFGTGPHGCIGEGLARLEIKVTLATLLPRWRLRPSEAILTNPSPQLARFPMVVERRA